MTNRRNTIQKDLVRNAVYEMRRYVTANERGGCQRME